MNSFSLPQVSAPDEVTVGLFVAWVQLLAEQRLGLRQHGSGSTSHGEATYSFGDPTDKHFVLQRAQGGRWRLQSRCGLAEKKIQAVIRDAVRRAASGDYGDDVVYQTTLSAQTFSMTPVSLLQLPRMLGDQVRIEGARRLSDRVLLEFQPKPAADPAAPQLFVPETDIAVTIFTPGPVTSDLSQKVADAMLEVVAAICALALGRVVDAPLVLFPLTGDAASTTQSLRRDLSIPGLARDGVSLDIFGELVALADFEGLLRARGALLSYHAALQQSSPDVALMLFVTSLEALIAPRPEWRKQKATKRFVEALVELCPDAIDSLLNHANLEQAFGYRKKIGSTAQRKQLLDIIYDLRSRPTHEGLGLSGAVMLSALTDMRTMRTALLSDLARGAFLEFLRAPRSSLIGHPAFD